MGAAHCYSVGDDPSRYTVTCGEHSLQRTDKNEVTLQVRYLDITSIECVDILQYTCSMNDRICQTDAGLAASFVFVHIILVFVSQIKLPREHFIFYTFSCLCLFFCDTDKWRNMSGFIYFDFYLPDNCHIYLE